MNDQRLLSDCEHRTYSQNGEDGIIDRVFELIGTTNRFAAEIGTGDGRECNTRRLREAGWRTIGFDREHAKLEADIYKQHVSAENAPSLFEGLVVPRDLDLLSIDVDGEDFYIWGSLALAGWRARLVVIEYNGTLAEITNRVQPHDPEHRWDGSDDYGASWQAMRGLGWCLGYELVYTEQRGVNVFLVTRDDYINSRRLRGTTDPTYRPHKRRRKQPSRPDRWLGFAEAWSVLLDLDTERRNA